MSILTCGPRFGAGQGGEPPIVREKVVFDPCLLPNRKESLRNVRTGGFWRDLDGVQSRNAIGDTRYLARILA